MRRRDKKEEQKDVKKEKKDKSKKRKHIFSISYLIVLIMLAVLSFFVYNLKILPNKYLGIFFGVIALIALILGVLNLKREKKASKIFYYILLIPTILVSLVGFKGIYSTNKVFNAFKNSKVITNKYYLVTNKEDIKFSTESTEEVGVIKINENANKAFEKLKETTKYNRKDFNNINELVNNLIEGKINIILLSEGEYDFVIEQFPILKNKLRFIYEFTLEEKVEQKENKRDKNGAFIVYIAGIDTRSGLNINSLTDVNILATVNPNTHEILLTNIPRDTYVNLRGTTGLKDKLTHAGVYGVDKSVGTIEDLFDIEIDNFIRINFSGVIKAIDLIGGVTVFNDKPFYRDGVNFKYGNIHLNGKSALIFSRERKQLAHGDFDRGKNQQKIISAAIQKISTTPSILARLDNIIAAMGKEIYTNITVDFMKEYAKKQIDEMPKWKITSNALEVTGSHGRTYSMPNRNLYIGIINEASLEKTKNEINEVLFKKIDK